MPTIFKNSRAYGETAVYGGFTPVGTIISVMGNDAPVNYLKCDGAIYSISAYPELATYFKDQFGSAGYFGGNGTTTFGVPDLRGEFLRGAGTNSHANQGSGSTVGTHQDATVFKNPEVSSSYKKVQYWSAGDWSSLISGSDFDKTSTTRVDVIGSSASIETSQSKTNGEVTSRPTNTSVLYCIAYKNIYIETSGGSGGSGHTILDTDGNSLPQEDNLQFKGLDVTDNSTDGVTEIEALGLNQDDLDELSTEGITTGFVQSSFNYSTEEQIVGKWVDGKPLYQKTIIFTTPSGGDGSIASGITNIDKVIDVKGAVIQSPWGTSTAFLPNGFGTNSMWWSVFVSIEGSIEVRQTSGYYGKQAWVTVQYTKTS